MRARRIAPNTINWKPRIVQAVLLVAAGVAVLFPTFPLHAQQGGATARASYAQAIAAPNSNSGSSFKQGMLTLHAQNRPLRSVLRQITQLTQVAINGAEELPDKQISVDLEQFRLDEALRQVLSGYDVFFLYGADANELGTSSVKAVWVYPAGRAKGLAPMAANAWVANTQEMERTLLDPDPNARARAIDSIIRRTGRESAEVVQAVLKDDDEGVRITALNRALSSGVEIPQEVLIDLALHDPSANIRFLALQALPVDPRMRWVAERAMQDESLYVSRAAQGIVGELDAAAAPAGN